MKLFSSREIEAPIEHVFDMVRNVEVHAAAVPAIQARAVAGRQQGELEMHEWTRWSARYFGLRFHLTMQVTACEKPVCYHETNRTGPFKRFHHRYSLQKLEGDVTLLRDEMTVETGFGVIGRMIDTVVLKPRLQSALETRMDHLKQWSEEGTWTGASPLGPSENVENPN